MATYQIAHHDAARAVTTLYALADQVGAPPGHPARLTGDQVRSLTSPPAHAISRDRAAFASNLRRTARAAGQQLPGDAPDTSGPYALHTGHPPPIEGTVTR